MRRHSHACVVWCDGMVSGSTPHHTTPHNQRTQPCKTRDRMCNVISPCRLVLYCCARWWCVKYLASLLCFVVVIYCVVLPCLVSCGAVSCLVRAWVGVGMGGCGYVWVQVWVGAWVYAPWGPHYKSSSCAVAVVDRDDVMT